eukprot:246114-Rhodomonas_salina.2
MMRTTKHWERGASSGTTTKLREGAGGNVDSRHYAWLVNVTWTPDDVDSLTHDWKSGNIAERATFQGHNSEDQRVVMVRWSFTFRLCLPRVSSAPLNVCPGLDANSAVIASASKPAHADSERNNNVGPRSLQLAPVPCDSRGENSTLEPLSASSLL